MSLEILASVALLFLLAHVVSAQDVSASSPSELSYGSLSELAHKHRALLLVKRAAIVDVHGGPGAMIDEALKADPRQSRRYRLAYGAIARRLNQFIRSSRKIRAVERVDDADFIIFFNLLEYRRPLGVPYSYGELFVILNSEPDAQSGRRVVWKSKKIEEAGDAASDLINDLRLVLGER